MKNKKRTLILLVCGLTLLLVGAGVLYDRLEGTWEPDNLLQQTPTAQNTAPATQPPSASAQTTAPSAETAQPTNTAPDFTVYDSEGNAVKLSDYFGKPVVVNFWASWCGPCQSEMPDFQAKYEELGDEVQFLMINMTSGRETLDSAKVFLDSTGYTFPVFYDTGESAAYAYSVYYLPTTYFIDAQGNAVARATSAIDAALLQQGIDMITSEE